MYSFWQTHRRKIAALLLILVPIVMLATSAGADVGEDSPSWPNRAGSAGLAWLHAGGTTAVAGIGEWLGQFIQSDAAEENEALREEVARLREEKSRLIGVLQENERLRKLVGFKTRRPEFELAAARVVARDVSPYFRVLKVKLKTDAELKPRMPVVVAEGVVGQVHKVYGRFADIIIVSDPRNRIDAISQRTRAHGIVEGLGHERDYLARIAYLRDKDEVRAGDLIVTSGMGGIFPKELIIGRVVEVESRERNLFQEVRVEPAVDFSRLEEVFIITGAK